MATSAAQSSLGWYLEQIKSTDLLTREEEIQLSRKIREHDDPVAREQMIRANLRLVIKIAKDYSSTGMTLSDLVAEGNLGLMRAVEEFDPDAGVRFSTYAAWWVKQAIKRALINAGQPIHIPDYLAKLISKWQNTSRSMLIELGRPPTLQEIAMRMHISKKKANIIQQGLAAVNTPSQIDSDEAQAAAEMLADRKVSPPDHEMMAQSLTPMIQNILDQLDDRSRAIMELRYGLDDPDGTGKPRTYKEIGEIIGLTRERVRQLEKAALANLKARSQNML